MRSAEGIIEIVSIVSTLRSSMWSRGLVGGWLSWSIVSLYRWVSVSWSSCGLVEDGRGVPRGHRKGWEGTLRMSVLPCLLGRGGGG